MPDQARIVGNAIDDYGEVLMWLVWGPEYPQQFASNKFIFEKKPPGFHPDNFYLRVCNSVETIDWNDLIGNLYWNLWLRKRVFRIL